MWPTQGNLNHRCLLEARPGISNSGISAAMAKRGKQQKNNTPPTTRAHRFVRPNAMSGTTVNQQPRAADPALSTHDFGTLPHPVPYAAPTQPRTSPTPLRPPFSSTPLSRSSALFPPLSGLHLQSCSCAKPDVRVERSNGRRQHPQPPHQCVARSLPVEAKRDGAD